MADKNPAPANNPLDARIFTIRGDRVMLDSDLAEVYEVETGALNRAVKRNLERFPERYAFRLSREEWESLRCQIGILNTGRGQHRKYPPYAFTEHGAVMLASVLNSARAVQASIMVVDAFIRLRRIMDANRTLARKIDELAEKVGDHDRAFAVVFHELRQLAAGVAPEPEPEQPKRRIGFRTGKEQDLGTKAGKRKKPF